MRFDGSLVFGSGLALTLAACASSSPPPAAGQEKISSAPIVVTGFSAPESALHDPEADVYLVSNISGQPLAQDHDGFISRVAPDGRMLSLRFIDGRAQPDGLSAPKGMVLVGRTLYVADIDRVRTYDADTGAAKETTVIPGAIVLNDMTAAPDGTVYVTDSAFEGKVDLSPSESCAIFALKAGQPFRRVMGGAVLGHPNGIFWNNGNLETVTFGTGEWLTIDPAGRILQHTKLPGGLLDGIVQLEDGTFVVSSWETSALYRIGPGKPADVLMRDVKSPADIGYDRKRQKILLPIMLENRLLIVPVSTT